MQEAMQDIDSLLAVGIIHPFSSPVGVGFFFVGKN